jgi:hypothetical protein
MFKRILLVFALVLTPTTVWANESTPEPEPSSTLEWDQTPIPGSENWGQPTRTLETVFSIPGGSYVPPPEASEGVGGWAVVHPGTGVVHGVIVATIDTYYANNGRMQIEFMGCPAGCLLRFQTRATADGNVAGWHGPEVKYNKSDGNFDMGWTNTDTNGTTTVKQKLIPGRTAADGWNLSTGLVDIRTDFVSSRINDLELKLTRMQDWFDGPANSKITISDWKTFTYSSDQEVAQSLEIDIDQALVDDGFDLEESDQGSFVQSVKSLTKRIQHFFGGVFSSE